MPHNPIRVEGRRLHLHSAVSDPEFSAKPVLSGDPWDYIELLLRRRHDEDAIFYWQQAKHFYNASTDLPETSSPLTSYYCFLNATKALLETKNSSYSDNHGVTGSTETGNIALGNEVVKFKTGGVLPALCELLEEPVHQSTEHTLFEILYHVPFVHRAFQLTYATPTTLFVPITRTLIVKKESSREAWFSAELNLKYTNRATPRMLPPGFEKDEGIGDKYVIRKKSRFHWDENNLDKSLERLKRHNRSVRKHVLPIFAARNRWYLKKHGELRRGVDKPLLPLLFGAMHRLSELARYDPVRLSTHLENQQNWLLTEFLRVAPAQFINHAACEISGRELIKPDAFRAE